MHTQKVKIILAASSLVLCLGFSYWSNTCTMNTCTMESTTRNPASQLWNGIRSTSLKVQKKIAHKLAHIKSRKLASLGRPADPLENFRFGVLEGKYALNLDKGKIREISFIDTPGSEGRPTMIHDRVAFLKENSHLFDLSENPERIEVDTKGAKIHELYRLKSVKGSDIYVEFVLDDLDRLMSLEVRSFSRKIF